MTIPEDERDPKLAARLIAEELSVILAWAVQGCLAWLEKGLKPPEKVRAATEAYRKEMDVLAEFLEECCLVSKSAEARASALYKAYEGWCLNGAKPRANFEETFSSLGPDNDGWDLSEWNLSNVDHTGKGSKSIYGEAVPNFNTVTKAAYIALDIGKSTTLQFYRRLKLRRANIMAKANFKAIINDGTEHIIDEESQELESDWLKRTIDLSPYSGKTITLKFVVTATDPLSLTSYAKAWIDDIVISKRKLG